MLPSTDRNVDQVGIDDCDPEPVHISDRIQSFGALISVTEDWVISHASANCCEMLGLPQQEIVGQQLAAILRDDAATSIRLRARSLSSDDIVDRIFRFRATADAPLCDVAMHRSGRRIVLEFEHSDPEDGPDPGSDVLPMMARISQCQTVPELCQKAVRQVKMLTGMNRVMVYQFTNQESGKVIAEAKEADMVTCLGLAYPALDTPQLVRRLLVRNQLRVIADVDDEGVQIAPVVSPEGEPLDLSLSTTRAVSPVHLEYLRHIGVGASMSISLVVRGEPWGLIMCHHDTAKTQSYVLRSAVELFGRLFSCVLEQLMFRIERQDMIRSQDFHDLIIAQLADDTSGANIFTAIVRTISDVIPHDGAIGWINGVYQSVGDTLDQDVFMKLLPFLDAKTAGEVYSTQCLADSFPDVLADVSKVAGILVLPVSRVPRDFIVLFRRETANKHCAAWTSAQMKTAEVLRTTLTDVVLPHLDANLEVRVQSADRLIAELKHRVRHIRHLIKVLVSQDAVGRNDVASLTKVIGGRIHALAMAYDQIDHENGRPAWLCQLIKAGTAAYADERVDRISVTGPDAMLMPDAHTTLALVIHEMMTNSIEYGALKADRGKVDVSIRRDDTGGLRLSWVETGGPTVSAPKHRGFGTMVIEQSIPLDLDGTADLQFLLTGVEAAFTLPAGAIDRFVSSADVAVVQPGAMASPSSVGSARILIVEDNIIIGLDAEDLLHDMGVGETTIVSRVADALHELRQAQFDFVLLDIHLGDETAFPVADVLLDQGVPFAFASGYGSFPDMAHKFADIPILRKPYDTAEMRKVVAAGLS